MIELCDWDPERNQPALLYPDGHREGCDRAAVLVLGSRGDWHLCEACADLPRFKRFKTRWPLPDPLNGPSRKLEEYPYARERRHRRRDGRDDWKICFWCGEQVTGRRQNWCSDACAHEWMIRRDPGYARRRVAERDYGVCVICGLDTDEAYRALMESERRKTNRPAWEEWFRRVLGAPPGARKEIMVGEHPPYRRIGGYWDMDHIVPVVKGGGGCGLDNLRTLCIPCHREETAKLARERAGGVDQLELL